MVRNSFKALSRIALVGLVLLVGCVDVDGAPEPGESDDSEAVESGATSKGGDGVLSATPWDCNPIGFGEVCSRTNENYNFVGLFDNNRGGDNKVRIRIWRDRLGDDILAKECDWHTVAYGESHRCVIYNPIAGDYYRTCVSRWSGGGGCTDWSRVK